MSITIYYLRRYGLSYSLAKTLAMDKVELLDLFLEKNLKLSKLYSKNKIEKLKIFLRDALVSISKSPDIFDDIYMIESCGVKLGTSKIYDRALTIFEFKILLETVDWRSEGLLSASEKLKNQIEEYNQLLKVEDSQSEILRWNNFLYFLKYTYIEEKKIEDEGLDRQIIQSLIKKGYLEIDKAGSVIMLSFDNISFIDILRELFCLNENYYKENKSNKSEYSQEYITLNDYLDMDFNRKEFLILRLEGKSLQEIGDVFGISRERVRQIVGKIINRMPRIYEVKQYHEVFSKYMISKDIFINIFSSDGRVYELLCLLFKKGKQDISNYILEGDFDESAKNYIVSKSSRIVGTGNNKKLPREYIIGEILKQNKHLQTYFSLEDIYYLYKEQTAGYPSLDISSIKGLDNLLDRCSNVIFSTRDGYRFHDINYSQEIGENLTKIIDSIPEGAYSMNWVYENYTELMNQLDILNGSELHCFFKKYISDVEDMRLGRNPEFVKGKLSKKEFILSKMRDFNGELVEKFVSYMNDNFGLNSDSLASYMSTHFQENVVNSTIFFKKNSHEEKVSVLHSILTEELYEKRKFYDTISNYFSESSISQELIFDLGYAEKGGVVVKVNYRSAIEAFTHYILIGKIFRVEDIPLHKTPEYYNTIQRLENELKILKISNNSYINLKYLEERGFDKNRLLKFISKVNEFTEEGEYFSIVSLINKGFYDEIFENGFELISLDRLISISDNVKAVSNGFPNIYCKNKEKKTLNDFLINELFKRESANLEDFTDDINREYGLNLEEYNVKVRLMEEGVYYSDILNKVYIIKEDYLNEVYGK